MRRLAVMTCLLAVLLAGSAVWAQQSDLETRIRLLVPYSEMRASVPGLTQARYDAAVRRLAAEYSSALTPPTPAPNRPTYLGQLGGSPYAPDSTSNPYGTYGSPYSPTSIQNPYGTYGNPYSPNSATNPYSVNAPKLFGADGKYLGRVSTNPYDPESISNPYGQYGSPYSPDSVNNPYGQYGSPYSTLSPTNPYTITPPVIVGDD